MSIKAMELNPNNLGPAQLTGEGNQFHMPEMIVPMDQERSVNNLLELVSPFPFLQDSFPAKALCAFDIHTMLSYINQYRIQSVTEFGFGVSTAILSLMGVRVRSFSLDVSAQGKRHFVGSKMKFTECDLMDENFREQIYASCLMSDLIVIDCFHSYQMAAYYYKHFLSRTLKPIFIHDMHNFARSRLITGEQHFLMDHVIDKTYEVFTATDLLGPEKKMLCEELSVTPVGKGMARCCAMILHPK